MSDNAFAPPNNEVQADEDTEFDIQLTQMWLNRTWSMVGGALAITALSFCFNPFRIVTIIAIAGCAGGALRAFRPPEVVKPHLRGRHILPGVLSLLGLAPAALILLAALVTFAMYMA